VEEKKRERGNTATRTVRPMKGSASANDEPVCSKFVATVSMMMMSEGISRITTSPVVSAFLASAV
jgi:hypothetical protein